MSDNDKTTVTGETAVEKKPAGNPLMKYGVMIGIVLAMAGAGYFITLKFIKPSAAKDPSHESEAKSANASHEEDKDAHNQKKSAEKKEHDAEGEGGHGEGGGGALVFEVENVIVNPAGTGGTRYLSVSVGFEVADDKMMALLEGRQPQIRDALITILGSKNIEQLTDMKQKEIARVQIKKRVAQLLATDEVSAVYFTSFVIQ